MTYSGQTGICYRLCLLSVIASFFTLTDGKPKFFALIRFFTNFPPAYTGKSRQSFPLIVSKLVLTTVTFSFLRTIRYRFGRQLHFRLPSQFDIISIHWYCHSTSFVRNRSKVTSCTINGIESFHESIFVRHSCPRTMSRT